jgi:hypothetical protein
MRYWPIILINAVLATRGFCLAGAFLAFLAANMMLAESWLVFLAGLNALGLLFIRLR